MCLIWYEGGWLYSDWAWFWLLEGKLISFDSSFPSSCLSFTCNTPNPMYNEKSLLAVYHLFIKLIHRCMLECQHGWFCVLCSMLLLKCNWSAGLNCKGYSHQVNFSEEITNQCFGWWRSFSRTSPQALWIKHHNGRIKMKYQLNILWAPSIKAQICSFLLSYIFCLGQQHPTWWKSIFFNEDVGSVNVNYGKNQTLRINCRLWKTFIN